MNKQNKRRLDEVVERLEEGTAGVYSFQLEHDEEGNELLVCTTSGRRYSWAAFAELERRYPDSIFMPPNEPMSVEELPYISWESPEALYAENEEGLPLYPALAEPEDEEEAGGDEEAELEWLAQQPPPSDPPHTEITEWQREMMEKLERMGQRRRRGRR